MGDASLRRFKASLSCYLPSYVVGSEEVLRALPAHLLKSRRNFLALSVPSFAFQKDRVKGKSFEPKVPSPLRYSAVPTGKEDETDKKDHKNQEYFVNYVDIDTSRNIGISRVLPSRSARRTNNGLCRRAYSLASGTKQSTEPFGVIDINSSSRPSTQTGAIEKRLEEPTKVPGLENAAGQISALRSELGKQRDRIRDLHDRLSRLERAERRSANIEKKVLERQDRLNNALRSWKATEKSSSSSRC